MDKLLKDSLVLLGLDSKEIQFYLATFKLGSTTINDVIKLSRLERSTAYLVFQDLVGRGLIIEDYKQYRKSISAVDPKTLLRMLSAKQRTIQRQEIELEEQLPLLQVAYKNNETIPKVRIYEGVKGLETTREDILTSNSRIYLWTNQETEHTFFTKVQHHHFIQDRVTKNIPISVLAVDNKLGRQLLETDETFLRQTKLLPLKYSFTAETYIYQQKIAIIDYKKDIFSVIIENDQVYLSQKAMFELTFSLL